MVSRAKRILLSLLSVVVAAVVCFLAALLVTSMESDPASFQSSEVALTIGVLVCFCLVGWFFSVPAVVMVTNIRGWRFWFFWVLGSCLGPLLMIALFGVVLHFFPHDPKQNVFSPEFQPLLEMAAAISSLGSLLYLLLLRRAQKAAS